MDAGKNAEGNFMIIHEVETADVVSLYNNNMVNLRKDYFKEMTHVGVAIKTEDIAIEDFTSILMYVIGWKEG